jgi:hypothetical protein
MRGTLIAAILAVGMAPAAAIERIDTPKAACATIQNVLLRDGAAILRQPSQRVPGLTVYDRYVGDSRACPPADVGAWASVPSRGGKACRVIACVPFDPEALFPTHPVPKPWLRIKAGG